MFRIVVYLERMLWVEIYLGDVNDDINIFEMSKSGDYEFIEYLDIFYGCGGYDF